MADDEEDVAALVVDNGSGMCKGEHRYGFAFEQRWWLHHPDIIGEEDGKDVNQMGFCKFEILCKRWTELVGRIKFPLRRHLTSNKSVQEIDGPLFHISHQFILLRHSCWLINKTNFLNISLISSSTSTYQ